MEGDQELKHTCKFCNKGFHSGRSLGGHMRTHLICSAEPDEKGHYGKKLPPLSQEFNGEKKRIDQNEFSNIGYSLRENPKKTKKFVKSSFQHMNCHSEKVSNNIGEDSWDSSNQSDIEASGLSRKKRSRRVKKISESLSVLNAAFSSPCVSEIDQEPEEAAMSLLLLSRDALIPRNRPKTNISEVETIDISENCGAKSTEMDSSNGFEVSKEKNEIKESDQIKKMGNPRKGNLNKRKFIDLHYPEGEIELSEGLEKKNSFECISCNKTFHSFQALGGHRASHSRIKGCFAPKIDNSENSTETEVTPNQDAGSSKVMKCSKEKFEKVHECPVCFKVFSSGQALGGHKRSHLIGEAKSSHSIVVQKSMTEERDFLDLNFPPPDEEESNDLFGFHKWWMQSRHNQEQLVGML